MQSDDVVEAVARIIADALGDDFADAFEGKGQWIANRGMSGGRFRDVNEPYQSDYLAAAEAAITAHDTALKAQVETAREALGMAVAEMSYARSRLETIATCNEDRRIAARLGSTCDFIRTTTFAATEPKP